MTPIGTKHVAPPSLLEQRTRDTYHQRYPWPDKDAQRVQNAMLGGGSRRGEWATALTCLLAVVSMLATLRGCT